MFEIVLTRSTSSQIHHRSRIGATIVIAILLLDAAIVGTSLLRGPGFPAGWDAFSAIYPMSFFARTHGSLHLWEETSTGYTTPFSLFHVLSLLVGWLGDSSEVMRLFTFAVMVFVFVPMFLVARAWTGSDAAAGITAFVYGTNQWVVSNLVSGHYLIVLAYALLPVVFSATLGALVIGNTGSRVRLVLLLGGFGLLRLDPLAYALGLVAITAVLLAIWVPDGMRRRDVAMNITKTMLLLIGGLPLLTAYVWLPVVLAGSVHESLVFDADYVRTTAIGFLHTLMGQGLIYSYLFWLGNTAWDSHEFLPEVVYKLLTFAVPVGSLVWGIAKWRRSRLVRFLVVVAGVSVFLAKGVHPPLGVVYEYLLRYIPLFNRLSEPNRWLMLTWFAYALLSGLLIAAVLRTMRSLFVRFGIVLFLALVVALPVSFLYSRGLLLWQPQPQELAPHSWLSEQAGEDRAISFPYAYAYGFDRGGWLQADLGTVGAAFSGHPGFPPLTLFRLDHPLGDFVRFAAHLVDEGEFRDFPRLLGPFNVRYFVEQAYPPTAPDHPVYEARHRLTSWHQKFLQRQRELRLRFTAGEARYELLYGESWDTAMTFQRKRPRLYRFQVVGFPRVYESQVWAPRVFAPPGRLLVVGGWNTLKQLARMSQLDLRDWNVRFLGDELKQQGYRWEPGSLLTMYDAVVLDGVDTNDLVLPFVRTGVADIGRMKGIGWDRQSEAASEGHFLYNRKPLSSNLPLAKAQIPVQIRDRTDELWFRVERGPNSGPSRIAWDGMPIGIIPGHAPTASSFEWFRLRLPDAVAGSHILTVTSPDESFKGARIDEIVVTSRELRESVTSRTLSALKSLPRGRVIYLTTPMAIAEALAERDESNVPLTDPWISVNTPSVVLLRRQTPIESKNRNVELVVLKGSRRYAPLLSLRPETALNWVGQDYFAFWFKGRGDRRTFNIYLNFASTPIPRGDWRVYTFFDQQSGWQRVVVPLARPSGGKGTPRWNHVTAIDIDTPDLSVVGEYSFGGFALVSSSQATLLAQKYLTGMFGGADIALALLSDDSGVKYDGPLSISLPPERARILSIRRESPSRYLVRMSAKGPYNLVLGTTYDPLWIARVEQTEVAPERGYGILNSYRLRGEGVQSITLEYRGQQWAEMGLLGALGGYVGGASYLMVGWWCRRRERRFRRMQAVA